MLVYEFDWRDLPIPDEIKCLLKKPVQYHVTVYVRDLEIELDATFPLSMKHLGFTVNEWDGITSTQVSVEPLSDPRKINYYLFLALYNSSRTVKSLRYFICPPKTPFNIALNEWVRKNT